MSKHNTEEITCPSCHHKGSFEIWSSINTVLNPELKEKVLSQELFKYTCPNCGESFPLYYSTLYHQMDDRIMIYLVSESEVEKTYELFRGEHPLTDFHAEKYLNRIVTSANQLVEKIQIFDAGKDDRIVELIKLIVTDYLHSNCPDQKFDDLLFATETDGKNILVILSDGEITSAVDIDNLYEKVASDCDDFTDIRDDDIIINRDWILNKLNEEDDNSLAESEEK